MVKKILPAIGLVILILLILLAVLVRTTSDVVKPKMKSQSNSWHQLKDNIKLPQAKYDSQFSVEKALLKRRSVRDFKNTPLTLAEVSQLLWSAQGITEPTIGFRTAPSAGALYPLEVYLIVGNVTGVPPGIYKYKPAGHEIIKLSSADKRTELYHAALGQKWVKDGAVVIVFSAVYERTTEKYGERGVRYVHMEAGHAAQNVYLQAVSLNLGTVVVGAFDDNQVKKIVGMEDKEQPLVIMPIGRK